VPFAKMSESIKFYSVGDEHGEFSDAPPASASLRSSARD